MSAMPNPHLLWALRFACGLAFALSLSVSIIIINIDIGAVDYGPCLRLVDCDFLFGMRAAKIELC